MVYCQCKEAKEIIHSIKEAVRMTSMADFLAQTDPIFNKFGLLKITDIGNLQISIFIFKFLKHDLPKASMNIFFKFRLPFLLYKVIVWAAHSFC